MCTHNRSSVQLTVRSGRGLDRGLPARVCCQPAQTALLFPQTLFTKTPTQTQARMHACSYAHTNTNACTRTQDAHTRTNAPNERADTRTKTNGIQSTDMRTEMLSIAHGRSLSNTHAHVHSRLDARRNGSVAAQTAVHKADVSFLPQLSAKEHASRGVSEETESRESQPCQRVG